MEAPPGKSFSAPPPVLEFPQLLGKMRRGCAHVLEASWARGVRGEAEGLRPACGSGGTPGGATARGDYRDRTRLPAPGFYLPGRRGVGAARRGGCRALQGGRLARWRSGGPAPLPPSCRGGYIRRGRDRPVGEGDRGRRAEDDGRTSRLKVLGGGLRGSGGLPRAV